MSDAGQQLRKAMARLELLRERNTAQGDALRRSLGTMADRSTTAIEGVDPVAVLTDPTARELARYGVWERARARRALTK